MRRGQCERQTAGDKQGFHNVAHDLALISFSNNTLDERCQTA